MHWNRAAFLAAGGLLLIGVSIWQAPSALAGQGSQSAQQSPAQKNADVAHPVLVELFTSEGCSSCPPADTMLQRMDGFQAAPDTQLIVLSEHVDYWDHDGWKDPYSSHVFTERQSAYVQAMKLNSPYTPQIIIDGKSELNQTNAQGAEQTLKSAAADAKVPVRIGALNFTDSSMTLHAQLEIDGSLASHDADVYVALALDHADSQVARGENSGKHLSHVAVVEELTKIGKLKKGKEFSQDVLLKLKPGLAPPNLRLVAFVQESGPGKILGVAQRKAE